MKITNRILKTVWKFLARMDVASILIILVLALASFGTFFPQPTPDVRIAPDQMAIWQEGIRKRYGAAADLLASLGVFKLYQTPYFITALSLLGITTLVCILYRWKAIWGRVFKQEVLCPDALFDNLKHQGECKLDRREDILVFQEILRARGFRVRAKLDSDTHYLRADRYRYSPLGRLVSHLAVVLLLFGALVSCFFSWRGRVEVDPGGEALLPAIGWQILQQGFEIERYRDGSVADYVASIMVTQQGEKIVQGQVRLNHPLEADSHAVYLMGFSPKGDGFALDLMIARDPGYSLVLIAGFLGLLGMTVSFNFPDCCIYARFTDDGSLRFVGRADRRACNFDDEFRAIETELTNQLVRIEHGH